MTPSMPAVFVSHGSPMLALDESAAHYFLKGMSDLVPLPKDILVVSAHWETDVPRVSLAAQPETIYDFGGFPKALYEMTYPAPGAPDLAGRAAHCLENAGIDVERDPSRGLDHGAWVPLKLIYPEADVPVAQLSIQPDAGPEHHYRLGQALKPLREEGTLILASGAVTHNLEEFFKNGFTRDSGAPDWVRIFAEWTAGALSEGRLEDLLDYRTRAPHAVENHPTEEHLLPLFVAMGAASETLSSERLHKSDAYGVLAMDVYALS